MSYTLGAIAGGSLETASHDEAGWGLRRMGRMGRRIEGVGEGGKREGGRKVEGRKA